MKNFALVVSVVAVAVLVAVIYLLFSGEVPSSSEDNISTAPVTETTPVAEPAPSSGTGTLDSLLARGEDLECTINYESKDQGQKVEGTYFTRNGAVRGDFVVPGVNGGSMVSSMIIKDGVMYSWSMIEGQSYGMKINLETLAELKTKDNAPEARESVPMDSPVSYNCKAWKNLDDSVFVTPSDVLFKDYADVGMEFGTVYEETDGTSSQCQLCQKIEAGEGKDQCLAAFKCL